MAIPYTPSQEETDRQPGLDTNKTNAPATSSRREMKMPRSPLADASAVQGVDAQYKETVMHVTHGVEEKNC